MTRFFLAALILFASAALAPADEKKAPLPVTATLTAKKTTYKVDLGGKTAEEYKKMLQEAEKSGKLPPIPIVEMALELKNTSDKDVQVWISGDPVVLMLDLKGKGAVSVKPQLAFTTIFIGPKPVTIEPGKTHSIPVTKLQYGFRSAAQAAYWTEPGEYTLSASFKTGISPAPKDTKVRDGFGEVVLRTEPITIKVEAK